VLVQEVAPGGQLLAVDLHGELKEQAAATLHLRTSSGFIRR
jgi:hypothetical protein